MSYFSQAHSDSVFNVRIREQKGRKILDVLGDYYCDRFDTLSLLDIGCSSGIISNVLSHRFAVVAGIDIDVPAITYAKNNYSYDKMQFSIQDASSLAFPDQSFDVVVCSHVYEHVSDPKKLMSEICRVLRPAGVCYFAAENRLRVMEPHYRLPLLSIIPRPLAHLYLRISGRGVFYHEKPLTLFGLRRLVSRFEVIDYTTKIIRNPQKYRTGELIKDGSIKQKLALRIVKSAYWLCPTYIWLLRKKGNNG